MGLHSRAGYWAGTLKLDGERGCVECVGIE